MVLGIRMGSEFGCEVFKVGVFVSVGWYIFWDGRGLREKRGLEKKKVRKEKKRKDGVNVVSNERNKGFFV